MKTNVRIALFLILVLLSFSACKDFWHPDGSQEYTVIFDKNGGNGTPPAERKEKAGTVITLPGGNGISKPGATFNCWNTQSNGYGTKYNAYEPFKVTKNTTLYAEWKNNISVTLNNISANGSSTQTTTQLTLTFSQAITGLSASNITLGGVNGVYIVNLSGSGSTYTLSIGGVTSSGTLLVSVSNPSGYTISGSPYSVYINYYNSSSGPVAWDIDPYIWYWGNHQYSQDLNAGGTHYYRFNVQQGSTYWINWDDKKNVDADKKPDFADLKVGLKREISSSNYLYGPIDQSSNISDFTATYSGTVIIEVKANTSGGKYGIGYGGVSDFPSWISLGDFTFHNPDDPNAQKGWYTDGYEGGYWGLLWEDVVGAKYLVLETLYLGNTDEEQEFRRLDVVLQGNGNSYSWSNSQTTVLPVSWASDGGRPLYASIYIVIPLKNVRQYNEFMSGSVGRITICSYPNLTNNYNVQNAWLVHGEITRGIDVEIIPGSTGCWIYQ